MLTSANLLKTDQATAERAKAIAPFGLTERQARFLATVMLHSGVLVGRSTPRSPASRTARRFTTSSRSSLTRRLVTPIELGSTGRKKIFHVHHKPLYAAIGEPDNRNRRPVTLDRAIERLMILDGVLADRSLTWLGSEREKRAYFTARLGDRLRDDEYPRLVFGKTPNQTVRYFPDKLPIGFEKHGYRHVFVYLARSPSPMDFRLFLLRHLELLNALSHWTIRVLFPRSLAWAMNTFENAAYDHLAKPLSRRSPKNCSGSFGILPLPDKPQAAEMKPIDARLGRSSGAAIHGPPPALARGRGPCDLARHVADFQRCA